MQVGERWQCRAGTHEPHTNADNTNTKTSTQTRNTTTAAAMTFWQENYTFIKEVYDTRWVASELNERACK